MQRQAGSSLTYAPAGRLWARLLDQASTWLARRLEWASLALASGLLALHLAYYARLIGFDAVDDAYISFRYALNWARGLGPVFNPGERVEGYTNFLWVAVLRLVAGLGLSMPPLSLALGGLFALATLLVLWSVIRRDRATATSCALFLLAADGSFALWAVSGLETALFGFLVFAGAAAFLRELRRGGFPFSGLLLALAAMTRPEGVLVFGLSLAYLAAYRLATAARGRRPLAKAQALAGAVPVPAPSPGDGATPWVQALLKPERPWRTVLLADAGRLVLFAAVYGAYFLWRYRYYGFLLPNTFYAKVEISSPDAQIARGYAHLGTFLRVHYGPLLPALMALPFVALAVRWAAARSGRLSAGDPPASPATTDRLWPSYSLLLVVAYGAYIVYVGGDWSIGRFFVPLLPFAYLLAAQGLGCLAALVERLHDRSRPLLPAAAILLLAVPLFLANAYQSSYRGERELYALPFEVRLASQARRAAGQWLARHASPDALLLVDAAGQMPFYSGLRAIDLFGLTDVHVAHRQVTIGEGTAGHEKVDLAYLLSQQPDYIVIFGRAFDFLGDYARVEDWTSDPGFARFLSIYRRRSSTEGPQP